MTAPRYGVRSAGDRGNNTRARILDAAAKLLSSRGYAETRLIDIAQEAGLRPPGLYYYFPSRDDLIAEVMGTGQRAVLAHVTGELAQASPDASALDRISIAVDAHLRVELELSDYATAVTRNSGRVSRQIQLAVRAESDAYHRIWRDLLDDAVAEGDVHPGTDLSLARMLVVGAMNWTPEWWRDGGGGIDDLVRTAQSFIHHGLAAATCNPPIEN